MIKALEVGIGIFDIVSGDEDKTYGIMRQKLTFGAPKWVFVPDSEIELDSAEIVQIAAVVAYYNTEY